MRGVLLVGAASLLGIYCGHVRVVERLERVEARLVSPYHGTSVDNHSPLRALISFYKHHRDSLHIVLPQHQLHSASLLSHLKSWSAYTLDTLTDGVVERGD